MTPELRDLCRRLFDESTKCQTSGGAAVLHAVKRFVEGSEMPVSGLTELWQVADWCANLDEKYERTIAALRAIIDQGT